ncbi:MAG: homocysteine S-methyltransferase [Gammaproteobacteria bacterium]|nr:homocysteine S-methyltransferase [Gammaproteobacteria bacterium]
MGRQLKVMGAPFQQPEWSALALMEAPQFVTEAHRQFIAAGANIITTNNYAVVPFHIGQERFEQRGAELNRLSAELAREAVNGAQRPIKIAGGLPPLFGSYRPDLFQPENATQQYQQIVSALAGRVDFWLGETVASLAEFRAIRSALDGQTEPFWVSFTLSDEMVGGSAVLRSMESISDMLTFISDAHTRKIDGVLFNCSQPELTTLALREANLFINDQGLDLISGGYANAFTARGTKAEANNDVAEIRDEITPDHYANIVSDWIACGASVIGGCCGIGPEHIEQLSVRFGA